MQLPQLNKTAVVTGGLGFIGSYLCELLANRGYGVIILDKNTYATKYSDKTKTKHARLYEVDIVNQKGVEEVLDSIRNIDVIFHLAAESHVDNSLETPNIFVQTNIIGTHNILELCRKRNIPLVYVSTDEIYGSFTPENVFSDEFNNGWTETYPIDPTSPYSTSKACGDLLAITYHKSYDMDIKITRCCNNFGVGQHIEKMIPKSITTALNEQIVNIYGSGVNIRQWIHASDHCEGLLLVHEKGIPGEIYNIGTKDRLTNNKLIDLIEQCVDETIVRYHIPDRINHDFAYNVNFDKIAKLGFNPKRSILNQKEINEMVEYYKRY